MMTHVQVSWTKFLVRETWIVCQGPNKDLETQTENTCLESSTMMVLPDGSHHY